MADQSAQKIVVPVEYMLTTTDNPYDPFMQFNEWFAWDEAAGYHTAGLLARITISSDDLGEPDQALAIQLAIEEILFENVLGIYKKVSRESVDSG